MSTTEVGTTGYGDDSSAGYSTAMIYGYGTASVAIISCFSLLGISLFPSLKRRSYEYIMHFLIGLGVGTLAADALLHIIPQVLGLHNHGSEEEHDHEHAEGEEVVDDHNITVWKMSVVYAGIYFLFFFETSLKMWRRRRSLQPAIEFKGTTRRESEQSSQVTSFASNPSFEIDKEEKESPEIVLTEIVEKSMPDEMKEKNEVCWKFTTVLLSVFLGDLLHNIADGMAIGVAFSQSATDGIGASIAVLCHEIPHEFGDFAIYLKNGASKWMAIGLNVVAACSAFIGLYIGIALSQDELVRQWLLAVIAGTFLYIALVQVMVEMGRETAGNPLLQFILQNLGLLIGWALMLLLALYEEAIEESFA